MAFDGRASIVEIDDENREVVFDVFRFKKITGTRVGPILGLSEFASPFKIACEIAGLYPGDKANKYIDAGNILEPVLRDYLRTRPSLLKGALGIGDEGNAGVEDPVPMELCGYDHFHNEKVFGGLVDGYIQVDGRREAVLEIKTSHDRDKWLDEDGGCTNVPMSYMLQASLYAELSNLDRIVFLVGFLREDDEVDDYVRPKNWVPSSENTAVVVKDKLDMKPYMEECEQWYERYIKGGYTPQWSDSESDQAVLKYLRSYDPAKAGKQQRRRR